MHEVNKEVMYTLLHIDSQQVFCWFSFDAHFARVSPSPTTVIIRIRPRTLNFVRIKLLTYCKITHKNRYNAFKVKLTIQSSLSFIKESWFEKLPSKRRFVTNRCLMTSWHWSLPLKHVTVITNLSVGNCYRINKWCKLTVRRWRVTCAFCAQDS